MKKFGLEIGPQNHMANRILCLRFNKGHLQLFFCTQNKKTCHIIWDTCTILSAKMTFNIIKMRLVSIGLHFHFFSVWRNILMTSEGPSSVVFSCARCTWSQEMSASNQNRMLLVLPDVHIDEKAKPWSVTLRMFPF